MFAPLIGGVLLSIDRALPVYTAVVIFLLAGVCTLFIREGERKGKASEHTLMH
jgi:hypothetical protein